MATSPRAADQATPGPLTVERRSIHLPSKIRSPHGCHGFVHMCLLYIPHLESTVKYTQMQTRCIKVAIAPSPGVHLDFFACFFARSTDWLAQDAKREAEFGVLQPEKGSLPHRLGQVREKYYGE